MKNNRAFLFLFLFLFSAFSRSVFADSVFCEACKIESNLSDIGDVAYKSAAVDRYRSLRRDANLIRNTNAIKFEEHSQYFRELRDKQTSKKTEEFLEKFTADLNALSEAVTGLTSLAQSLTKIPPQMRVEFEDKVRSLQKIKIGLLLKQPLLADSKIRNFLQAKAAKQDFEAVPADEALRLAQQALQTNVLYLQNEHRELTDFLDDDKKPEITGRLEEDSKNYNRYLANLPQKFPEAAENLVLYKSSHVESLNEYEKRDYCQYETALYDKKKWQSRIKFTADAALVGASFAAGPLGRGLALATGLGRAKLLEWGISAASETYLISSSFADYNNSLNICKGQFATFTQEPNPTALRNLSDCQDQLSSQLISSSIASAGGSLPLLAKAIKIKSLVRVDTIPDTSAELTATHSMLRHHGAVTYSKQTGDYTIFDLGRKDLAEKQRLNTLSENYLGFVTQEYKKRLNLREAEVDSFIETSKAFKDRTTYIVSTKAKAGASAQDEIQGGVGLVTSTKPVDLLPLEKATGLRIDRSEGGVAEIVRLTTARNSPPGVASELLDQVSQLILTNPSLQTIYIYTSTAHARLYKRYGIFVKEDRALPNGRDVLLKIDVNEMRQLRVPK